MKKPLINCLTVAATALLLPGCTTISGNDINDAVSSIEPSLSVEEIHNTYLTTTCGTQTCTAGNVIDEHDVNHPVVTISGEKELMWFFPSSVTSLFEFEGKSLAADRDGTVYQLDFPYWSQMDIKLLPKSQVLWSEDDIVACTEPLRSKLGSRRGSCYAVKGAWSFDYDTAATSPVICGEQLRLVSFDGEHHVLKAIRLPTGFVVSEYAISKDTDDLCNHKKSE